MRIGEVYGKMLHEKKIPKSKTTKPNQTVPVMLSVSVRAEDEVRMCVRGS